MLGEYFIWMILVVCVCVCVVPLHLPILVGEEGSVTEIGAHQKSRPAHHWV